jgi:hypothetical protein
MSPYLATALLLTTVLLLAAQLVWWPGKAPKPAVAFPGLRASLLALAVPPLAFAIGWLVALPITLLTASLLACFTAALARQFARRKQTTIALALAVAITTLLWGLTISMLAIGPLVDAALLSFAAVLAAYLHSLQPTTPKEDL